MISKEEAYARIAAEKEEARKEEEARIQREFENRLLLRHDRFELLSLIFSGVALGISVTSLLFSLLR